MSVRFRAVLFDLDGTLADTLPIAVLSPVSTHKLFFWLRPSKNF